MLLLEEDFLKYLQVLNYSEETILHSKSTFNIFANWMKNNTLPVHEVKEWTPALFEKYFAYLKTCTYTKKKYRTVRGKIKIEKIQVPFDITYIYNMYIHLKMYLEYLVDKKILYASPFEKFEVPQPKKQKLPLDVTQKEIHILLNIIDTSTYKGFRDRTMTELIYGTGMRMCEVRSLNIDDVNIKDKIILVKGKGKKQRLLPLGEVSLGFIREYMQEVRKYLLVSDNMSEKALFLSYQGTRFSKRAIGDIIRKYTRKAGLHHVTTHKIRHAFAMHMIRQGCDIRYIQALLGHSHLSSTTIYTEVFNADLKEKVLQYHPLDNELKGIKFIEFK